MSKHISEFELFYVKYFQTPHFIFRQKLLFLEYKLYSYIYKIQQVFIYNNENINNY